MGFFYFNLLTISYMVTGAAFRKPSKQNLFFESMAPGTSKY